MDRISHRAGYAARRLCTNFKKRLRFFRCDDSATIGQHLRMRRGRMADVSTLGINATL
jgi:hypothetical protein